MGEKREEKGRSNKETGLGGSGMCREWEEEYGLKKSREMTKEDAGRGNRKDEEGE